MRNGYYLVNFGTELRSQEILLSSVDIGILLMSASVWMLCHAQRLKRKMNVRLMVYVYGMETSLLLGKTEGSINICLQHHVTGVFSDGHRLMM